METPKPSRKDSTVDPMLRDESLDGGRPGTANSSGNHNNNPLKRKFSTDTIDYPRRRATIAVRSCFLSLWIGDVSHLEFMHMLCD